MRKFKSYKGRSKQEKTCYADLKASTNVFFFLLFAISVIWSYWPNILSIVRIWQTQPDYSHGFLVIPIAGAIAYINRSRMSFDKPAPILGILIIIAGLIIRIFATKYFLDPIANWTIMIVAVGCVLGILGWQGLRWTLPSIIFLVFAMPLPYTMEIMMRQPLQYLATKISCIVLVILGFPAVAEASVIRIGSEVYGVNEACSGLRIFWGIAAFAFAIVVISRRSWPIKTIFTLSVVPVALVANSVRIVITCILFEMVGTEAAKKFSHDIAGLIMVPLAVLLLVSVYQILNAIILEVAVERPESVFRRHEATT